MADINAKDFNTLVSDMVSAVQAKSNKLVSFVVGSIMRAFIESVAGVALWLQGLFLTLLGVSRASTSKGADLDSWMADFKFYRVAAVAASGTATFFRFSPSQEALVPVGTIIQSTDGLKEFEVVADIGHVSFNEGLNGYTISIDTSSISVPIVATSPGAGNNALTGEINTLTTVILGVDTVANDLDIVDGLDTESDTSFRLRFTLHLDALAKATTAAVSGVVAEVRPGLKFNIVENLNFDGSPHDGYFYVVVDDGTGNPSQQVLDDVSTVVEECRPLTSKFGVYKPVISLVDVTFDIVTPSTLSHSDMVAGAKQAVTNYINSLGLGETLSYTYLSKVVYDYDSNILNIKNLSINMGTMDVVPTKSQVLKADNIVVN